MVAHLNIIIELQLGLDTQQLPPSTQPHTPTADCDVLIRAA